VASIAQLQQNLNALLMQETKANSEKHLVLSMLCESYTQRINDIGYSYHNLIGFYQQAVEVLNNHFKEHKLSNLLTEIQSNPQAQTLLQKARNANGSFSQRWSYLDFENAISNHLNDNPIQDNSQNEPVAKDSNYPLFTRPFFIALKNLQS